MTEQKTGRVATPERIATNSLINFAGYLALMLLAVWAIPIVIAGVSSASFGLLSLIWAIVGYFALLDFGFSRAATKFLAKTIIAGKTSETRKIIGTAFIASFLLGLLFCFFILAVTPYLISELLRIPPELIDAGIRAFRLSAFAIPIFLVGSVARGVFMAAHRFGIINILQTAAGIIQWIGAVVAIKIGGDVYAIVVVLLVARTGGNLAMILLLPKVVKNVFRGAFQWDKNHFRQLARFGGWATVSQIVGPLIHYIDRFIVSFFLTLTALAYYAVPQEIMTRLLVIPQSLAASLYPALSEVAREAGYEARSSKIYFRSLRFLGFFMLPIVIFTIVYAREILFWWIGEEYAVNGALLLQILAVGLFFNAIAQVPFTALHAYGYPNLPAKFHLIQLPITIILNLILIPLYGIVAAALVWSFRVFFDLALVYLSVTKKIMMHSEVSRFHLFYRGTLACIFLLFGSFFLANVEVLFIKNFVTIGFLILYILTVWFYVFDAVDRSFLFQLRIRILGR